jgi:hypothetical protein
MHAAHHNVAAHCEIRTKRYKLIYYYYDGCGQAGAHRPGGTDPRLDAILDREPEWELFDLETDPYE